MEVDTTELGCIDLCMSFTIKKSTVHVTIRMRKLYICEGILGGVDDWKQT